MVYGIHTHPFSKGARRVPHKLISVIDHSNFGGGFGDTFLSISTLGGDTPGGGWESQSSSVFANGTSLDSSRESSLPDGYDEDN